MNKNPTYMEFSSQRKNKSLAKKSSILSKNLKQKYLRKKRAKILVKKKKKDYTFSGNKRLESKSK